MFKDFYPSEKQIFIAFGMCVWEVGGGGAARSAVGALTIRKLKDKTNMYDHFQSMTICYFLRFLGLFLDINIKTCAEILCTPKIVNKD